MSVVCQAARVVLTPGWVGDGSNCRLYQWTASAGALTARVVIKQRLLSLLPLALGCCRIRLNYEIALSDRYPLDWATSPSVASQGSRPSPHMQQCVHHFIPRQHFRKQNRTRFYQKNRERALLKQDPTLLPQMRMNIPNETLSKGMSMPIAPVVS